MRCWLGHRWRAISVGHYQSIPWKLVKAGETKGSPLTRVTYRCERCQKIKQREFDGQLNVEQMLETKP